MIGQLIRRWLARTLGPEMVYPGAATRSVNLAVAEYAEHYAPMASIHYVSTTEENDGPEIKAA